ncbi:MAG: lactate racemase domain-containing protein [bacterium]|nr:lactate racemase domain-containing protein [bacterium]
MSFPKMALFRQTFAADTVDDIEAAVVSQLRACEMSSRIRPGQRIAVTGGSRGIANISVITRLVVDAIRAAGGVPFIMPAMGSHGGATAAGQKEVLASYGLGEDDMGCPVEATMEVVELGHLEDGTPILVNRLAHEADGIVVINRVKPHTSFRGSHESGVVKMLTIGLGCHRGATMAHAQGAQGLARLIPALGEALLGRLNVIAGIALVENAYDRTASVTALRPEEFLPKEPHLLAAARVNMPRILARSIDLLIVDEMGKNISGTGMDTNVIGRMMLPGVKEPDEPGVSRIFVRRLSARTHGNANGVGLADVITKQLFDAIDFDATYANAFTSTFLNRAYIPIVKDNDRKAIAAMFEVLRIDDGATARVARIVSTLDVEHIHLSEPLAQTSDHPDLQRTGAFEEMRFDESGSLV